MGSPNFFSFRHPSKSSWTVSRLDRSPPFLTGNIGRLLLLRCGGLLTDVTASWGIFSRRLAGKTRYLHEKTILSSSGDPAHVAMPGVHRVVGLLKRWILGTHQGSIVPAHLQSYLEEFTFRFNRRTSKSRGLVFRRLIEQAVITGPVTEADVTFGYDWGGGR